MLYQDLVQHGFGALKNSRAASLSRCMSQSICDRDSDSIYRAIASPNARCEAAFQLSLPESKRQQRQRMDRYFFEGLVGRLEAESERNPGMFRSKVLRISVVGYVVLFVMLIALAGVEYLGFTWARGASHRSMFTIVIFGITLIPIFFAVLRMFFMRLAPPEGRRITRKEAPRLFEVLDKMRKKLKGPPIHHVLIDERFNAAVSQIPRWGFFGNHTNYLILGLPYLLGVPSNEMLATVAHEYGHLCGHHGKLGAWIYRQRRTFGALYEQVEHKRDRSWAHALFAMALDRFMPYYNAYTFVLSRQNEYEADSIATRLVGAETN